MVMACFALGFIPRSAWVAMEITMPQLHLAPVAKAVEEKGGLARLHWIWITVANFVAGLFSAAIFLTVAVITGVVGLLTCPFERGRQLLTDSVPISLRFAGDRFISAFRPDKLIKGGI